MRIAVSTSKGGLKDSVWPVFARCPTYTFVDVDEKKKRVLKTVVEPNPAAQAFGGAGIAAAQEVIGKGANAVITGACGPNALAVLLQANVKVFVSNETVEKTVKDVLNKKLSPLSAPSVPEYFGVGGGRGGAGRGGGFGRGGGRGSGRRGRFA